MGTATTIKVLQPGDVLLSLGIGKTSAAIKALDGGKYSHAALWTGAAVIESTTPCVHEHSLEESLEKHPREYVDAYRYRGAIDAGALGRVIDAARTYVDRAYSYGDLVLCASLMAIASTLPKRGQVKLLKEACEFAHFMTRDRPRDGEHVTCTQLVVRSYSAAGLSIQIEPRGAERVDVVAIVGAAGELAASKGVEDAIGAEELEEWRGMQAALQAKCAELNVDVSEGIAKGPLRRWDGHSPVRAEGEWRSNLVTPRNLEESFEFQCRIFPSGGAGAVIDHRGTPARRSASA
jgi:hypothetical protein